ncbi:MAG: hypothetical protein AVDCRST_MAG19-2350, partial [uncultured Thermomicrobiales bacterium]
AVGTRHGGDRAARSPPPGPPSTPPRAASPAARDRGGAPRVRLAASSRNL